MQQRGFMMILVLVVLAGLLFVLLQRGQGNESVDEQHVDEVVASYEISAENALKRIQSNDTVVLLDVRTQAEFDVAHLENAILVPVQELSQESLTAASLGEDKKDQEIIIYCRSGARSKMAYDIMEGLGYTNIKSLAGGMIHWEEDEHPVILQNE